MFMVDAEFGLRFISLRLYHATQNTCETNKLDMIVAYKNQGWTDNKNLNGIFGPVRNSIRQTMMLQRK
eukprot:2763932-Amphidinium_carterae.1